MGNTSDSPVRRFTAGKLTHERLNESVDALEDHARRLNSLENKTQPKGPSGALPCKITDVGEAGKYYADAYLPPYKPDSDAALTIADLGTRTVQVILWNLGEINGGGALSVGDVVDASVAGFDPSGYPLMKTGGGSSPASTTKEVRIVSYERDDANYRWAYTVIEHRKIAAGFGDDKWEDLEDAEPFIAYNDLEHINEATGNFGVNVTSDELGDCELRPIAVGTPVSVRAVPVVGDAPDYYFSAPNTAGPIP